MIKQLLRIALCGALLHGTMPAGRFTGQANAQTAASQAYNSEQLDALLAPIALYPDALLAQVLMASTFPLQVVGAGRWVEDPANKPLGGDALAKALEPQPWDPSVKSLVPFPSVLALMNSNLEWMQQLGYAFAEQQVDVMNSAQRLRFHAQGAGNLKTTEQQIVRVEKQTIIIEPATPTVVYVPSYNPVVVYGAWPYPSYPPVYLPPPPGYVYGAALVSGIAFATGVIVVGSLWGWARPGWGTGYVNVNVNNYNNININRTQINSNVWRPNRPGGNPAGFPRPPNGPVGRPGRPTTLPASATGRPAGRPTANAPRSAVNTPSKPSTTPRSSTNRPNGGQVNTGNRVNSGNGGNPGNRVNSGTGSRSGGGALTSPGRGAASPGQRPSVAPGQRRGGASAQVPSQGRTNAGAPAKGGSAARRNQ
jgi:Protein of unknown function (DUF3300)